MVWGVSRDRIGLVIRPFSILVPRYHLYTYRAGTSQAIFMILTECFYCFFFVIFLLFSLFMAVCEIPAPFVVF